MAYAPSDYRVGRRDYSWKLGTHIPRETVKNWANQRVLSGLVLFVPLLVVSAIGSTVLVRARHREHSAVSSLRTSEKRMRAVVSELAEGLVILDRDG